MAVSVEMHNTGDPGLRAEVTTVIEHLIVGSQANDRWELKITGPNAFERSYTLEGSAGQHEPQVIRGIVARMVSGPREAET